MAALLVCQTGYKLKWYSEWWRHLLGFPSTFLIEYRLATLGKLVPTLVRLHKLASHTMPGTRQETRHLLPLPKSLLRAKCGTPKPPPGPPPSHLVMARGTTTSEPRCRSRTPTRDVQITSLELELLPDDSQPANDSPSNRSSSLGATCKPGCYMLAALRTSPKMSATINGSSNVEPNRNEQ